jgi:rhodanese-related sulfurtransferase
MPNAALCRMPEDVDRSALQRLRAEGAAIVEVLPSSEFESEHLPGAISLPLGELRAESAEQRLGPDKRRAVVVYCQGVD